MAAPLRFDGRVALVTGAGNGAHAHNKAAHGSRFRLPPRRLVVSARRRAALCACLLSAAVATRRRCLCPRAAQPRRLQLLLRDSPRCFVSLLLHCLSLSSFLSLFLVSFASCHCGHAHAHALLRLVLYPHRSFFPPPLSLSFFLSLFLSSLLLRASLRRGVTSARLSLPLSRRPRPRVRPRLCQARRQGRRYVTGLVDKTKEPNNKKSRSPPDPLRLLRLLPLRVLPSRLPSQRPRRKRAGRRQLHLGRRHGGAGNQGRRRHRRRQLRLCRGRRKGASARACVKSLSPVGRLLVVVMAMAPGRPPLSVMLRASTRRGGLSLRAVHPGRSSSPAGRSPRHAAGKDGH